MHCSLCANPSLLTFERSNPPHLALSVPASESREKIRPLGSNSWEMSQAHSFHFQSSHPQIYLSKALAYPSERFFSACVFFKFKLPDSAEGTDNMPWQWEANHRMDILFIHHPM